MSPMMAPSMINLLDTRRRMETSSLLFSSRETASPGWRTSKKKRLDAAAEASLQPRTACPGTKIAPRRSVCQHPASMARPAGKKRPPGCGQSGPAGGPASQGRWQSLDLSVLPLAADMATAVGHGRFGSAKGALGGSAGTALASGAYRMAIAEESTEHIHAFHQGLPRVSLPVTTAGAGRRVMRQGKRGIV